MNIVDKYKLAQYNLLKKCEKLFSQAIIIRLIDNINPFHYELNLWTTILIILIKTFKLILIYKNKPIIRLNTFQPFSNPTL